MADIIHELLTMGVQKNSALLMHSFNNHAKTLNLAKYVSLELIVQNIKQYFDEDPATQALCNKSRELALKYADTANKDIQRILRLKQTTELKLLQQLSSLSTRDIELIYREAAVVPTQLAYIIKEDLTLLYCLQSYVNLHQNERQDQSNYIQQNYYWHSRNLRTKNYIGEFDINKQLFSVLGLPDDTKSVIFGLLKSQNKLMLKCVHITNKHKDSKLKNKLKEFWSLLPGPSGIEINIKSTPETDVAIQTKYIGSSQHDIGQPCDEFTRALYAAIKHADVISGTKLLDTSTNREIFINAAQLIGVSYSNTDIVDYLYVVFNQHATSIKIYPELFSAVNFARQMMYFMQKHYKLRVTEIESGTDLVDRAIILCENIYKLYASNKQHLDTIVSERAAALDKLIPLRDAIFQLTDDPDITNDIPKLLTGQLRQSKYIQKLCTELNTQTPSKYDLVKINKNTFVNSGSAKPARLVFKTKQRYITNARFKYNNKLYQIVYYQSDVQFCFDYKANLATYFDKQSNYVVQYSTSNMSFVFNNHMNNAYGQLCLSFAQLLRAHCDIVSQIWELFNEHDTLRY